MDTKTFEGYKSLMYDRAGIALNEGKDTLVSARLGKRMRALGISDHKEYLQYALDHENEGEITQVLDAICTNFTNFYRESDHFDLLEEAVEGWISAGQRRFRIWSAACSSGEEPYSMAVSLLKVSADRNLDMKILATDLSTKILQKARAGRYEKEKVKPVPPLLREKYFQKILEGRKTTFYQAGDVLKGMISFRGINLSAPPFPMQGPLDIVFCRNVMIYFDNEVRSRLINEIYRLTRPGGYLMVGHSESLAGITTDFKVVRPSVYLKQ